MGIYRIWANRLEDTRNGKKWKDVPGIRVDGVREVLRSDVGAGRLTAERYEEITGEAYKPDDWENALFS